MMNFQVYRASCQQRMRESENSSISIKGDISVINIWVSLHIFIGEFLEKFKNLRMEYSFEIKIWRQTLHT